MKRLILFAAALAAGLSACVSRNDVRYSPNEDAVPLAYARMMKISSVDYRDVSGGISEVGASVELERPFIEIFREGIERRLRQLKIRHSDPAGTLVDVELTGVEIKSSPGTGDVTATVAYAVIARGGLDAVCRQEVSSWAVSGPTQASSPAKDALTKALAKAVDRLGPAIEDSCLYTPQPGKAIRLDAEALVRPSQSQSQSQPELPPSPPATGGL